MNTKVQKCGAEIFELTHSTKGLRFGLMKAGLKLGLFWRKCRRARGEGPWGKLP